MASDNAQVELSRLDVRQAGPEVMLISTHALR